MKQFYLIMLIMVGTFTASAQIRHVRGIKSADLSYGVSGYGQVVALSYVKYLSKKSYYKVGPFFESGDSPEIKYTSIGVDGAFNYTVVKITEGVYVNALAGVTASTDALTDPLTLFEETGASRTEDFGTLKFGVLGGTEIEAFVTDRFVIIGNFNQRLMIKENFGKNRYFVSIGVRYNF